jgi:hypothetical protein
MHTTNKPRRTYLQMKYFSEVKGISTRDTRSRQRFESSEVPRKRSVFRADPCALDNKMSLEEGGGPGTMHSIQNNSDLVVPIL